MTPEEFIFEYLKADQDTGAGSYERMVSFIKDLEWSQVKSFVKNHKKAILIGAAIVVAAAVVITAVAIAVPASAAAAGAAASTCMASGCPLPSPAVAGPPSAAAATR